MNWLKRAIDPVRANIAMDDFRRLMACYRATFFYMLLVCNVLSPMSVMMHCPRWLLWSMALLFSALLAGTMSSSQVFSRDRVFAIARYVTIGSLVGNVVFVALMSVLHQVFHIHIKPL